jgi:Na+-translocating ferredoxin:NAD+ oxidoreductase RnfD subunit
LKTSGFDLIAQDILITNVLNVGKLVIGFLTGFLVFLFGRFSFEVGSEAMSFTVLIAIICSFAGSRIMSIVASVI